MSELEAAITDVGTLLVQVQKYRRGAGDEGHALRRDALALGDAARRQNRRGALDAAASRGLLSDAQALVARLRALLAAIRSMPAYGAAITAHAAGDQDALAQLLPGIFTDLEPVPPTPDLFQAIAWRRRGRPRPAADLVAEVVRARDEGLAAEGDDLSPGTDASLVAVVLRAEPPLDEPLVLRVAAGALGLPFYRLTETGEYLLYTSRLRAPLSARLAHALDEGEIESSPLDYGRYRAELAAALAAAGVPVD